MQQLNMLNTFFRNLIRKTRTNQLQSVDNSSDTSVFLGRNDKDFDFTQITQKIRFAESSAKNNKIEQLQKFINDL
jgi:signal recognition particle receptor subunit beta